MLCRSGLCLRVSLLRAPASARLRRLASRCQPPRAVMTDDVEDAATSRCGFKRAEMFSEPLAGTVKPYDCHVLLCSGGAASWAQATDKEAGPHAALDAALQAPGVKAAVGKVKTTLFEAGEGDQDGDILLFPQMLRYRPATGAAAEATGWEPFVRDVLLRPGGATSAAPRCTPLPGAYTFVCAHARRDKRCGVCGPPLIAALRDAATQRGVSLAVRACSHVGGHAYAGNVLVFDRAGGVPRGTWLGYVAPEDVPSIVEDLVAQGKPPQPRLWRGSMGMSIEAVKAEAQELFAACGSCEQDCSKP